MRYFVADTVGGVLLEPACTMSSSVVPLVKCACMPWCHWWCHSAHLVRYLSGRRRSAVNRTILTSITSRSCPCSFCLGCSREDMVVAMAAACHIIGWRCLLAVWGGGTLTDIVRPNMWLTAHLTSFALSRRRAALRCDRLMVLDKFEQYQQQVY